MIVYHYHPDTKEYLGVSEPQESPLEPGVYLIPEYATEISPFESTGIEPGEHQQYAWLGDKWGIWPDYRTVKIYSTKDGSEEDIRTFGEDIPKGYTIKQRLDWDTVYDAELDEWVLPFENARDRKLAEIRGMADELLNAYKTDCSQSEIQTWDIQKAGAIALTEDINSQDANAEFVRNLAEARGISLETLVEKIMRKAQLYSLGSAKVIGIQQALEDKIWACTTAEQLDEISFPEISL
jgi:hypothetical protein